MYGRIKPLVLKLYQNVYVAILAQKRSADYEANQDRTRVGKNCFHCNLFDTSRRAITDNAMSIKATLHAESFTQGNPLRVLHKGSNLKILNVALLLVCAASPWLEIP